MIGIGKRAWSALRDRYHSWSELALDRKYGIDTDGIDDNLTGLGAEAEGAAHGYGYEAIQLRVFRQILQALPIDFGNYTFIDFGAGKARALILAAEAGFQKCIGVELAPELVKIAEHNIERYKTRSGRSTEIRIILEDARIFQLPEGQLLLFFYNPFDQHIMREVLQHVYEASRNRPEDIYIAYRNPRHKDELDAQAWLIPTEQARAFSIYRVGN
jgi:hypothetical protein